MEDFDVREFAQMFDAALASDNSSVKKALRNFMMIAAIVHAEQGEERLMGPLETLVKKVYDLENIVRDMQRNKEYDRDYYKGLYGNQTWVYNPNTGPTSSSITGSSKSYADKFEYSAEDLNELMKDLKIK